MEPFLERFSLRLLEEEQQSRSLCPKNGVTHQHWPIPFFGKVGSAKVLTVGVNPSITEFLPSRNWHEVSKISDWQQRILNYFTLEKTPRHDWFEAWDISLELLGCRYQDGSAAHLDVSPRITPAMTQKFIDRAEFRKMVEHDVKWLFELLEIADHATLLLIAGPIISANCSFEQLGNFIRGQSARCGWMWQPGNPLSVLSHVRTGRSYKVFVAPYDPQEQAQDGFEYCLVRNIWMSLPDLRDALYGHDPRI
jgi:hypothetical protein